MLTFFRAYEISTVHNREPPPKEILEDVSAKGGDLLNRTVDNFFPPSSREAERLRNGEEDSEDDEEGGDAKKTPKDDKMEVDEPGSVGRSTRCMICHDLPWITLLMSYYSTPPCAPTARSLPA
jgi:chromatin structure-remodeling complex subunit RSC9